MPHTHLLSCIQLFLVALLLGQYLRQASWAYGHYLGSGIELKDKPALSLSSGAAQAPGGTGHLDSPDPPVLQKLCLLHHSPARWNWVHEARKLIEKRFNLGSMYLPDSPGSPQPATQPFPGPHAQRDPLPTSPRRRDPTPPGPLPPGHSPGCSGRREAGGGRRRVCEPLKLAKWCLWIHTDIFVWGGWLCGLQKFPKGVCDSIKGLNTPL